MIQDTMAESTDPAQYTDEALLRASQRDPELYAHLVARYEAAFLRKARSILKSPEDAEEVVQDAFTRIYVAADRYTAQEGATFSSWAYTVLVRIALTRYQKLKVQNARVYTLDPEAYERLADETSFLETLSLKDEVLVALAKLPEAAARVLRLQFLEGKTQEEIAAAEGSTVPAVKTRVHRAKKQLKDILETHTTNYDQ